MTTKVPAELSSTPSIVDNGDATAITIDSSERVGILQGSPTSNLHIGASGNDAKRELRIDGTNGSGQTYGCIIEADGENGRFVFKVGQSGNTPAQQFMVHPDGGICFGSDTAAANALDDYEEGTFSGTTNGSVYSGTYTKIGRICHVSFESDNSSSTGTSIAVMPFSAKAGTAINGSQPTFNTSNTNDNVYVAIYNGGSTAYIYSRTGSTQSVTTGSISVNFVYETD
jgi:hypothetical protein